ncbi:hypothetical protein BCR36DRAFT_121252 [Piromyces finnis]|uniref:Uncharacterized protein n=1 Tax=Piromyces finnis TaxID=1754191 RepID=A0A1Y1V0W6_9FUNG|nr:hypothetical protein BCR36DRAFT_121252 [Piromyces finnis]|eukprot:ORX44803.1 hypothetical protein BCR36DRAFT_121252 [Piromyces finnis]
MYMHELEIKEIYNKDPCYKLAWCFDASLQYQTLRIKEARLFFDGVKSKDPSYADISMIIANPYNCNMLADQIFLKLKELSVSKKPITDDEDLIWMTNILNLGFTSRTMIQKNNFKVQKFDKDITEIFYPAIINMIAENEAKENIKEKDDKVKSPTESDSSNKKTAQSEYLTDDVISVIQKSDIALKVFIFYLFNCLENIDANALGSALKVVKNNHEKFGDDFLQTFSSILSKIIAEQNYLFASSSQFKTVVIDKFLTTSVDLSSSLHELALKIVMELMRAGAIWDKFTAWIDKIFTTGKIDDEEKFQRLYKEIYDFGTSQSKDLVIERFSWHYAPNMLKFLDIDVPPTPPPAPITPSPSIMQPSPNTLTGNMMPWNNMRPPVEAGNMNPMMNNSMNPMNSINPMIQMGMQPGMNSNMNPGINQIQMNPMNSMNPMINNNMNGPNGMNMMNNMNKMGGYNRYGYNNHNSGYRPRGGKYRNNRSYTPHYNNNNNYYNNNGPGKRSYNDMDPGFNHYNNDQSYKNRNMNNNMNNNNNNNSENIYYG